MHNILLSGLEPKLLLTMGRICYYRISQYVEQNMINPRRACAARVTVVVRICLFVPTLTNRMFTRPTNNTSYPAGDKPVTFCGIVSETAALQRSSTPSVVWPFFMHVRYAYEHAHTGSYTPRSFTLVLYM